MAAKKGLTIRITTSTPLAIYPKDWVCVNNELYEVVGEPKKRMVDGNFQIEFDLSHIADRCEKGKVSIYIEA